MMRALVIAGFVAILAAVGLGVGAGQNQTPPESVVAVRQNAPLVAKPGREAVERTLARAVRVGRAGERHDPHDLRACTCRRLEAVAADDVEADPDRPQGAGNTSPPAAMPGRAA